VSWIAFSSILSMLSKCLETVLNLVQDDFWHLIISCSSYKQFTGFLNQSLNVKAKWYWKSTSSSFSMHSFERFNFPGHRWRPALLSSGYKPTTLSSFLEWSLTDTNSRKELWSKTKERNGSRARVRDQDMWEETESMGGLQFAKYFKQESFFFI
jgi:hypothetical protein